MYNVIPVAIFIFIVVSKARATIPVHTKIYKWPNSPRNIELQSYFSVLNYTMIRVRSLATGDGDAARDSYGASCDAENLTTDPGAYSGPSGQIVDGLVASGVLRESAIKGIKDTLAANKTILDRAFASGN